jgi:hypothetical protein
MFNNTRKQNPTQEMELSSGFFDPPNVTSKLQAKQAGVCTEDLEHVPFEVTRGPPGTFNFSKGDASWNAECGGTPDKKRPQVFKLGLLGCNGKSATVAQSANCPAEGNPHAVQDSVAPPVFLQGPHHPASLQALERLLQKAMPVCYED